MSSLHGGKAIPLMWCQQLQKHARVSLALQVEYADSHATRRGYSERGIVPVQGMKPQYTESADAVASGGEVYWIQSTSLT